MTAHVIGYARSTATDVFYLQDDLIIFDQPIRVDAKGGWPFDHFTDADAPMSLGDVIAVTVNMWCTHDPDVIIGHFETPSKFIPENWTALAPQRFGRYFSQTWWRVVGQSMLDYDFVDVLLVQGDKFGSSGVFTDSTGVGSGDGGEVIVTGWTGTSSLRNVYKVESFGETVHTPDTTDTQVLNFFLGGGGAGGVQLNRLPTQTPLVSSNTYYNAVLDDNNSGPPDFEDEFYGIGMYQPAAVATEVGHWETPVAQDALLVGIGPPVVTGDIAALGVAGGIVRMAQKSVVGGAA